MSQEIKLASISECVGCGNCKIVCPTNSISWYSPIDSLHQYPEIDNKTCIKCGKCMKVCPMISPIQKLEDKLSDQKYFCAWTKNEKDREASTSGGIGTAISRYALKNDALVIGCYLDDKFEVKHIIADDESNILKLRGSKYLQSDTTSVFSEIIKFAKEGKKILFIGTPCQVDAVKRLIPEQYIGNLFTVSIICHGVNSPVVWKDYVKYLEVKHNSHIKSYNFRSKKFGWGKLYIEYTFENGKKIVEKADKNLFHVWFGLHYMMREVCYNCRYRTIERFSDIVIGDFWGIEKICPDLDSKKGISVAIACSNKGLSYLKECKEIKLNEVSSEETIKVLKGFVNNISFEVIERQIKKMKEFSEEYRRSGFKKMAKKYHCPGFFDKVKDYLSNKFSLS